MNGGHSGVFLHIVLFQIEFPFCWMHSESKPIPQWLSGLLLLAETYSKSCCQFSYRLESFFRSCLVSYDLKSRTPCFGPWLPVSDTAVKHEATVWQTGSISAFSSEKINVFSELSKSSWLSSAKWNVAISSQKRNPIWLVNFSKSIPKLVGWGI